MIFTIVLAGIERIADPGTFIIGPIPVNRTSSYAYDSYSVLIWGWGCQNLVIDLGRLRTLLETANARAIALENEKARSVQEI